MAQATQHQTAHPNEVCVYVIDDNEVVRRWLEFILVEHGWKVVSFSCARDFLASQTIVQPCCVVIDLLLPGMTGLELCRWVARHLPGSANILISGGADLDSVVQSMKWGAVDFLQKPVAPEKLLSAVSHSASVADRRWQEYQEEEGVERRLQALSPRERQIFDCIAEGYVTKQISARLNISRKTVDVHRSKIMHKLAIDSPTQLARLIAIYMRRQRRWPSPDHRHGTEESKPSHP